MQLGLLRTLRACVLVACHIANNKQLHASVPITASSSQRSSHHPDTPAGAAHHARVEQLLAVCTRLALVIG